MGLTRVSIMRPIFILMVILAIVVLGWQSQQKMAVDLYPKIDIPFVAVATIYPGAGPEEIETLVSKPLEDAVSSINKVKNVTSASQEGVSTVSIEFDLSADLDAAAADVRDRVSAEKGQLPQDAEEPTIIKFDIAAMPVLYLGLSSKMPPAQLRRLVDDVVKDRLSQVAGVAGSAGARLRGRQPVAPVRTAAQPAGRGPGPGGRAPPRSDPPPAPRAPQTSPPMLSTHPAASQTDIYPGNNRSSARCAT